MKRITAAFYATESGNEPVRDWLLELAKEDRVIVGADIATVEFGWPIAMPVCRNLREGVLEVRSTIKRGRVEARAYFSMGGRAMLLLHGHEGKRGQDEAISLAIDRPRDHKRRQRESDRKRKTK
ncbi:MAG: type II toxin-antitoxin system RelE/ParE family toxin [Mesorhizobium sp.]|nr:MAG: type II toxin-antitoxin system RelE/ParE family toxin [Mesorhizobium sp.]